MVQRAPGAYILDLTDPRAPTDEQWAAMSAEERARVVAALPADVPLDLAGKLALQLDEERRGREEERRGREEERRGREEAERRVAELEAELVRLRTER